MLTTEEVTRETLGEGIYFTRIRETKFKSNHLSVSFLLPLRRETATANAILPLVLRRGCHDYPDMTALNRRLMELYGARLEGGVSKNGEVQVVTLYLEILADEFGLENEKLLSEGCNLLRSVIFDPVLANGAFRGEDVEIEKRNLADLIDSQLNDKRYYASLRLKQEMCRDEAFGVYEYGSKDEALTLTPQEITAAWTRMLTGARVEIFLVGSGDDAACKDAFQRAFAKVFRSSVLRCDTRVLRGAREVKNVVERMPVNQAKLGLGFRAGVAAPGNSVAAMQLASTLLGGSPHSKLFLNVREKLSLCYYCYSRFERLKGLMFIESGIEEVNEEKAKEEILRQLDDLKAGNFSDDDQKFAVLSLENVYRGLNDQMSSIAGWYLLEALTGIIRTPAQAAQEIRDVTRDEIVKAAAGIELDTVYLLAGDKEA